MEHFEETAFAKVNLALHVRRRRDDGYHELETLFAFADDGDRLTARPADEDSLTIDGEFADGLSNGSDNLVLRALHWFRAMKPDIPPLAIHLEKRLPVAAGIGGGSADAAALIRLVNRQYFKRSDIEGLALASRKLGADVPACVIGETRVGVGVGEDLHRIDANDIAGKPIMLVNPRVPLATGPVFAAWDAVDNGALSNGSAFKVAQEGRNDLEGPATKLAPVIGEILGMLNEHQGVELTRMSGSGATCFALFDSVENRDAALHEIAQERPEWWTMASQLR